MSFGNLEESFKNAEKRLNGAHGSSANRKARSDRGRIRLPVAVAAKLESLLASVERPPMRVILSELDGFCRNAKQRMPARATLYSFMASASTPRYVPAHLPKAVQSALYNLDMDVPVPAHQLAFYCFNYGDLAAASFAAGLPWLALYQAAQMRGFRPKSRGLLDAVMRVRGI